jgi:flagellar protein FliL
MSAAPAPAAAAPADASAGGGKKKKLIIIGAVVAVLLAGGGGGALYMMKKKAAEEAAAAEAEDGGDGESESSAKSHKAEAKSHAKDDHAAPPTFVPLDPFVVNLTDREQDRYAQVGLTLQVDDPKLADQLKLYMPAIRNAILLLLSHKSSEDLLNAEGKERLAQEIRRDAARAMGYEVEDPFEDEEEAAAADGEAPPKKKKKKKKKAAADNPITQVHYANFIIQ